MTEQKSMNHFVQMADAQPALQGEVILSAQAISHGYSKQPVLQDISLEIHKGEWLGIIGPNGSGKSTLLSILSRAEQPSAGQVQLYSRPLGSYKRKELSRLMAVLQQETIPPLHYTVREVVEMGRFPYQSWWGTENEDSGPFIDHIMERLQLEQLADRRIDRLSGGQRQRVALAKLMAQSPSIILLDEPTTYLDIHYQMQFMDIIRDWQQDCGLTVVSVLHDLNLAALYCDRIAVLNDGIIHGQGSAAEMITRECFEQVFHVHAEIVDHPRVNRPQVLLCPEEVYKKVK
nr:ABC transporter ATP-binding protein [Paenibacillus sp. SC116]